jgi:hypothetical protein
MSAQRETDRAQYQIDAFAGPLDDFVPWVIDDVGVVADAADQKIGCGGPVEPIVAPQPLETIIGGSTDQDIVAARSRYLQLSRPIRLRAYQIGVSGRILSNG